MPTIGSLKNDLSAHKARILTSEETCCVFSSCSQRTTLCLNQKKNANKFHIRVTIVTVTQMLNDLAQDDLVGHLLAKRRTFLFLASRLKIGSRKFN